MDNRFKGKHILILEGYARQCLPYMRAFKKLGLEDALALLEKMGVYGAKVVLDPVLLLSREQWKNVASICPVKQDYILCYYMPTRDSSVTSAIKTLAEQIAEKTGYRIVNIGKKEYEKLKFWECNLLESGPAEFVALFAGAKYVVTNSFHGTAFSLKNNVPFFVPVNFSIPEDKRLSNRIECLLRMFGCSERIVDEICEKYVDSVIEVIKAKGL